MLPAKATTRVLLKFVQEILNQMGSSNLYVSNARLNHQPGRVSCLG